MTRAGGAAAGPQPFEKHPVMLRSLLRRFGVARATTILTLASVVLSVMITAASGLVTSGGVGRDGLLIAILVPSLVAPIFGGLTLRLAYNLNLAEEEVRRISVRDPLTDVFNRRYFFEVASREFARAKRYHEVFSIIIFDLDNFKAVNDTYGHLAGDDALRAICRVCLENIRAVDIFARYGGEEFVLLLPRTDQLRAGESGERLREVIAAAPIAFNGSQFHVTTSLGLCTFEESLPDLDAMLMRADEALFAAKRGGKNNLAVKPKVLQSATAA